ncbi:MAG: hypothetical protein HUK24_09495 [Sphaerochaetaceae bacterium]|nr:hypothetical protein [Sphaerochaetaceae bacterium]
MDSIKYQLETIPVWDGIQSGSECFICDLMEKALKDSLDFYLGSSVMNPETRVKVNEKGFCPHHTELLVNSGKAHSMAVMWESHFEETRKNLDKALKALENPRNIKKDIKTLDEVISKKEEGCLICDRMTMRLDRYCLTVPYLWNTDNLFKKAFEDSKGFCLPHMNRILQQSLKILDSKAQKEFAISMAGLQRRNLERVAHDLWYMTEHFKSENHDKPWNGCEDGQKRAVFKEIGKGRITTD